MNIQASKMKETFEVVEIEWYPKVLVKVEGEEWGYVVDEIPEACRQKAVFYCIYGAHPVYGEDVLLYIGETKSAPRKMRDIAKRVAEHLSGRFQNMMNLSFTLGVTQGDLESGKVKAVESVLISAHKPALNRQSIDAAIPSATGILIRNYGFSRALMPELSGSYWCD